MNYTQNLLSLKAFLSEKKYIIDVVKFCQLKHDPKNWKRWYDDYGNVLSIDRNRNPSIKLKKNINYQTLSSKDLYLKAHISKLSFINKFSLISIKDDGCIYMWMLDENNIMRLCMYENNILCENKPVLISGVSNLKKIISVIKIEGWEEMDSIMDPTTGSKIEKSFATSWPPTSDLINLLPEIIKKDCNLV